MSWIGAAVVVVFVIAGLYMWLASGKSRPKNGASASSSGSSKLPPKNSAAAEPSPKRGAQSEADPQSGAPARPQTKEEAAKLGSSKGSEVEDGSPKSSATGKSTPPSKSVAPRKSVPPTSVRPPGSVRIASAGDVPRSERDSSPSSRRKLPRLDDDDDDDDITIVTLNPHHRHLPNVGDLPSGSFDDEETPPPPGPEAVPIIYDRDAALDEPTRIEALILVSASGQTDLGQKRRKNEDSYLVLDEHNLFVVADGMGGHAGGEVASKIAVEAIADAFRKSVFSGDRYHNVPRRGSELALAIQMANEAIFERARKEPELTGMGTTVVAARFSPNKQRLYVGHVGDSRCYRLRDQELKQVTTDHTMGAIGITGPLAERLERALGIAPAVKVDVIIARPMPNDVYLLCTDGLSKMVSLDTMRDILVEETDLTRAVEKLIKRANESGGRDNITVILVQVRAPSQLT